MADPHPLDLIKQIVDRWDVGEEGPVPTLQQIQKVLAAEYDWWGRSDDEQVLWQVGYLLSRLHDHPDSHPYVNDERVFAEHWAEENNPPSFLNGGVGLLQHLLTEVRPTFPMSWDPDNRGRWELVTKRDWIVSCAVIRWLGTNVGRSFLAKVHAEIERIRTAGIMLEAAQKRTKT